VFKFVYFCDRVKSILSGRGIFCDLEVEQELAPVLESLKRCGEVEGASCGRKPGVMGLVYEVKGKTFHITYTVDAQRGEVKFYEFQQISHLIDWKAALETDLRQGEEEPVYIPQIGDPQKLIRTIQLISDGINTAKDLGIAFGSGAKNDENLSRRGDYLGRSVLEIGLVKRVSVNKRTPSVYILTERGEKIARANESQTRERLLAEALLGFYPIQLIIEKTTRDDQELTKELIQEVISLVSLGDCGGETNPRRAGSLRALVNWVSRWAGIPIRREGHDGVQLYIPQI
jgi:hypothetical protein